MKVCLTLICLFLLSEYIILFISVSLLSILHPFGLFKSFSTLLKCFKTTLFLLVSVVKDVDLFKNNFLHICLAVPAGGRFSIRYEKRNIFSFDFLHVSITDLKPSDSGRYRCRSDGWKGTLYDDFDLVVTEGEFSGLNSDFRISDLQSHHLQTATHEDTNQ
uniref:Immunoglobulin subtype domain-containing protein n=1 Tax=Xiphophorus maculatus TaxID=8083 RepID=A0A3B5QIT5_XIPMA